MPSKPSNTNPDTTTTPMTTVPDGKTKRVWPQVVVRNPDFYGATPEMVARAMVRRSNKKPTVSNKKKK